MAFEMKEGQGSLFKNRERKSDKQPAMKGRFVLNGKMYEIAGWSREIQKGENMGEKFLSLKIQEPMKKERREDDLPF